MVLPDNNANTQDSNTGAPAEALQSSFKPISDRAEIARIFQQLLQLQTTLTVQFATPEGLRTAQATVLRIDSKAKPVQVFLHQAEHATWYRHLQDKPTAKITCHMPNGRLAFTTQLEPLETVVESTFMCHFPLPEQIRKSQARSTYRVSVLPGTSLAMLVNADTRMGGECVDLSIDGCCLVFHSSHREQMDTTGQIRNLMINLDGIADLTVTVKVCRVSTTKSGRLIVGAQYLNLTPQQQNSLQAALTQIQRQQLQKKVRLS